MGTQNRAARANNYVGSLRRQVQATALLFFILSLAVPVSAAAQSWLYAFGDGSYAVVDPQTAEVVASAPLEIAGYSPSEGAEIYIVPTPGGRYVFFHVVSDDVAVVVDAESHRVVRSIELPAGTRSLQFSSMGDAIYLEQAAGRVSMEHRRGQIEGQPETAPSLDPGRIAFNRRATRIYGQRDGRLVYALAQNGDAVADVRVGSDSFDWHVSPNFRYLLGSSQTEVVLVDEQRARVVGRIRESFTVGSAGFDTGSRELHVLSGDGQEIIVADVRRVRVRERLALDRPAVDLSRTPDGAFQVRYADGSLGVDVSGRDLRIPLAEIGGASSLALVVLKPGQGFACF